MRFVNRDGTFNVVRHGISFLQSLNTYHALLRISWRRFFGLIIVAYFVVNGLFAGGYYLCGPGALGAAEGHDGFPRYLDAFFFSVQTLSTIGYGGLAPSGLAANILVSLEALAGLLIFAVSTGLVFARFSRPVARILFSERAVVAPYHGITAFEFRIVNALRSQLVNVQIRLVLSRMVERGGTERRMFEDLPLERASVTFFPLHLTVVHPIDEQSPLRGVSEADLERSDAEFIVLVTAFDETFSSYVHTRSSYKPEEIVHGAKFVDMFIDSDDGRIRVDMAKLHAVEAVSRTSEQ